MTDWQSKYETLERAVKLSLFQLVHHKAECAPLGQGVTEFCIQSIENNTKIKREEIQ